MKLIIAYLGGPFAGWQRQQGERTVQGEIEATFTAVTGGLAVTLVGAGRTDAGVHAAGQTAHLDLVQGFPVAALARALNGALPAEIRVRSATRVGPGFHARKDARGKLYTYRARFSDRQLPWAGLRCACLRPIAHPERFARALAILPGRRDMASFSVVDGERGSGVRSLFRVWASRRPGGVDLHFVGDGFLRYQVRRMVGALFEVGWGQRSVAQFRSLLDDPRPGSHVLTAPAAGLTLERVFYRPARLLEPA